MVLLRTVVLVMLTAGVLCFGAYIVTGGLRWRMLGLRIVRWTVVTALVFFAVLIAERLARTL
jgi:hypothetical protein